MMGNICDVDPDDVRIGMPVRVAVVAVDDGYAVPIWRPADLGVGSGCVSTQLPGLPVALPKRVLLKGLTAGRSQGSGREPERHQRHGKDPRGQANQLSQGFSVRRGERAERRTESECTCSQQEVLDGWEYGRCEPGFGYAISIPADHNEDRGGGDSAGLALMDVADDSLREPTPYVVEAACGPCLSKVISDRTAARRRADHDEDPGLHVLGTRRLCRGLKYRGDQIVLHRRVAESAAGALMVDRPEARNGHDGKIQRYMRIAALSPSGAGCRSSQRAWSAPEPAGSGTAHGAGAASAGSNSTAADADDNVSGG
jgi:hypothetical protein